MPEQVLRRDAERNRRRMLAAARELFAERGLAATLDDVARRAGLGVGTVYRRFPNKESLIDALFVSRIEDIGTMALAALEEPDPWQALSGFLTALCEVFTSDRGLREVMLGAGVGRVNLDGARDRLRPAASRLVSRARRAGVLRPEIRAQDLPTIALMISAISQYTGHVHPDLWRRYLVVVLDGLRAGPGQPADMPPALASAQLERVMLGWHASLLRTDPG